MSVYINIIHIGVKDDLYPAKQTNASLVRSEVPQEYQMDSKISKDMKVSTFLVLMSETCLF